VQHKKLVSLRNKLRSIRLVWVTVVALQILLSDKYNPESLQGDGSRTRQEIPQTAGWKARACNCCFSVILYQWDSAQDGQHVFVNIENTVKELNSK